MLPEIYNSDLDAINLFLWQLNERLARRRAEREKKKAGEEEARRKEEEEATRKKAEEEAKKAEEPKQAPADYPLPVRRELWVTSMEILRTIPMRFLSREVIRRKKKISSRVYCLNLQLIPRAKSTRHVW